MNAAPDSAAAARRMRCGLCGLEFDPTLAERSCTGCPLVGSCGLVRCPRCGYEMPPEAQLAGWLRSLRRRLRPGATEPGTGD